MQHPMVLCYIAPTHHKFCVLNPQTHSTLRMSKCQTSCSVPGTLLEAGRACRATSGWVELWACRLGTCCSLGIGIMCCAASEGCEATSSVCWEGTVVGGKCAGLIFSAISCSLILSISTRLSSCKNHWLCSNWGHYLKGKKKKRKKKTTTEI